MAESRGDDAGFVVGAGSGRIGNGRGAVRWLVKLWEYRTLRRIWLCMLLLWVIGWVLPLIAMGVLVTAKILVPGGLAYYPASQDYWIYSDLLKGWKGVMARVYIYTKNEVCRDVSVGVMTCAAVLGVIVGVRGYVLGDSIPKRGKI